MALKGMPKLLPPEPSGVTLFGDVIFAHVTTDFELRSPWIYRGPLFVCLCLVTSDSVTPWTVACQAPLSIGFSRQEY